MLLHETNLMKSLIAWLEDDYYSIIVTNHRLITIIRFVAKNYIHLWKSFINKLHLVAHALKILFLAYFVLLIPTGPDLG